MAPAETRIAQLKQKLEARTQDGKPLKGYAKNVIAIKSEIERLQKSVDELNAKTEAVVAQKPLDNPTGLRVGWARKNPAAAGPPK